MHYDPRVGNGGLAHDPLTALVVPRPIGWISTIGESGIVNLAPYSFFNAVAANPPFVMFASAGVKHSQHNAERTGEFVHSLATWDLREQMNITSAAVAAEVSEPVLAGLEMAPSVAVKPPRVKRSPVAFECRYVKTVDLPGRDGGRHPFAIVIGEVVSIYIDDALIHNGIVDTIAARPIARLGYLDDYAVVESLFKMKRPV
ncbi:MAG TPA: flavin reductase family protein [Candidatus Binataceae bacterium]|jgi:flavin reductase (DIM6/NTAB) family NADH-FMN oxidoreductase RutF|nr:flavin reductase family protein [Candidatus Binataceae bacterium]